ncbi:hypothetical protein AAG570_013569 [Ranatra chinensis]|uniref:Carboxylic ester hydrolase n=1 Tax=Ranatra chinensis TaxID=642074 RepID=A0ABD0YRD0_9HEMI
MSMTLTAFLALAGAALCLGYQGPEVTVYDGPVQGLHETTYGGRRIASFLGIPYAKPPAGKYRFHEAVAPGPWLGVYNATSYGSDCMQYSQVTYKTSRPVIGSEDCLYINVHTPKLPIAGETPTLMDVIVYIHGGAFMFKYGDSHGPRYLLDRDVVLVTFNYRVGPLGFMSTGDEVIPGNNGLKDQVLALKWIKDNIAVFGGNPESVTLMGTSAGGASVHYHYLSPLSRGLFKAGLSMSGSALSPWALKENPRENTLKIAAELGCPTNDTRLVIKCLRKRPAHQIVAMTEMFMPWMYNPFSPFGPTVEIPVSHGFLTEPPVDIIKSGRAQDLPWMATFTSEEGLYPAAEFFGDPKAMQDLEDRWDELMPYVLDFYSTVPKERWTEVSQKVKAEYLKGKPVTEAISEITQMLGDRHFVRDIVQAAKLQASVNTSPVYAYKFAYRGKHSTSEFMAKNSINYGKL